MSKFFRLRAIIDEESAVIDMTTHKKFSFTQGIKFNEQIKPPVKFKLDSQLNVDFLPTTFLPEPVFREDFILHLRSLGVKNFDDYEVEILYKNKKIKNNSKYRVINITSSINCADLKKSQYEKFEDMYFFDKLVIESNKVSAGADIFRVGEAHEFIILTKKIADQINVKYFPDIQIIPVEQG